MDIDLDQLLDSFEIDATTTENITVKSKKATKATIPIYIPTLLERGNILQKNPKKIYVTKGGIFIKYEMINDKLIKYLCSYFSIRIVEFNDIMKSMILYKDDKENKRLIIPRFGLCNLFDDTTPKTKYQVKSQSHNKAIIDVISDYSFVSQIDAGESIDYKWIGKLDTKQTLIVDFIMKNYYNSTVVSMGMCGLILKLEAGQGKSYIMANLIYRLKQKTLIVVHNTSMVDQTANVLKLCLGNISIGYYYTKRKVLGDVMIMVIDSVKKDSYDFTAVCDSNGNIKKEKSEYSAKDLFKKYGLFIYDEAHLYANNKGMKALLNGNGRYMLGLSATPDETAFYKSVVWKIGPIFDANQYIEDIISDRDKSTNNDKTNTTNEHNKNRVGKDNNLEQKLINNLQLNNNISPNIALTSREGGQYIAEKTDDVANLKKDKVVFTADVNKIMYYGPDKHTMRLTCESTGMINDAATTNMICADGYRNMIIVECIEKCLALNLNIFVFSKRRSHLETIRSILMSRKRDSTIVDNEEQYMKLVGGTNEEDMKNAADNAKVILTTYSFMATGRSIPRMTAMVLANSFKTKPEQVIKRIMRLGSDYSVRRQIYDIVDMNLYVKGQFSYRKKFYDTMKYNINIRKINWDEYKKIYDDYIASGVDEIC